MNSTSRKVILILLSILVSSTGLFISWNLKPEEELKEVKERHRLVRLKGVKLSSHKAEVRFSGKLSAEDKIDVFTEVGGVLLTENFKQGNTFSKGNILVQLNSIEFSNNLKASKSQLITQVAGIMGDLKLDFPKESVQWVSFLNAIDVKEYLPKIPDLKSEKLKRFVAGKGILNSYFSIKSQEEKLSKFSLKAPFDGVLTNTFIQKGTLVRAGQKIGEFINPSLFELETEISLSDLQFVKKGSKVLLHSDDLNKNWEGFVSRVNSSLDPSSQMVRVFIRVKGKSLKEGMFLRGFAKGVNFENATLINRKLLKNGGVYLVDSNIVRYKKVEVVYVNEAKAIVKGLEEGSQYVSDNMKGLYDGLQVTTAK
jgi:multidrug efflux pump subunit AcrA (membrane-fusion protein)